MRWGSLRAATRRRNGNCPHSATLDSGRCTGLCEWCAPATSRGPLGGRGGGGRGAAVQPSDARSCSRAGGRITSCRCGASRGRGTHRRGAEDAEGENGLWNHDIPVVVRRGVSPGLLPELCELCVWVRHSGRQSTVCARTLSLSKGRAKCPCQRSHHHASSHTERPRPRPPRRQRARSSRP